jgi:glycosyltransferase involved in cell wall biosynthesis
MKTLNKKNRAEIPHNGATLIDQLIREAADGVLLQGAALRRNRKQNKPAPEPQNRHTPQAHEPQPPINSPATSAKLLPAPSGEHSKTQPSQTRARPVLAVLCFEDLAGPVGEHVVQTSLALARNTCDVVIFSRNPFEISDTDIRVLAIGPEQTGDLTGNALEFCQRASLAFTREFGADTRSVTLLAHEWSSIPALLAAPPGLTTILCLHSLESQRSDLSSAASREIQEIEIKGLESAGHILIADDKTAAAATRLKPDCAPRIVRARCEFPIQDFANTQDPGAIKKRVNIGPVDPVILYIGDMNEAHGPDLLMKAVPAVLKNHPQARFVFVGDGALQWPLRVHARYLLLEHAVRMLGHVSGEALLDLIHAADIICAPSREHTEEWPVLAGWAAKKPVLSTHPMSGSFLHHEKDSVLCYASENSIVWGVERLLFDKALSERLAEAGHQNLHDTHGWPGVARQIGALLDKAQTGTGINTTFQS